MRAQQLMTHPAVTCHASAPLNTVANLMWHHDCGVIAVVNDDGKLTGMITDRDICMAAYTQGRPLREILASAAMSHQLVAVGPNETPERVLELMAEHRVHRIAVVDDAGLPLGVVSLTDLVLESVQPDTEFRRGTTKVAEALAAITHPRKGKHQAA